MNIENKLEAFRMDDGLKNLTKKLNEFNPFRILRIESFEIRHSNMLAWLLNPKGNHELGNSFLKSFLYKTINNKENKPKVDALEGGARIIKNIGSLDDYSDLDYSDLIIEREKYQIDILATSTKGTFVLLIENKIYSDERTNQLETYYKKVKESYRKHIVLPIYLTLFSEPPSHNSYFVASYLDIVEILDDEIKKNKNKSDKPSYQFINDYNKILKELLNMDKEIDDLCRGIFAEHRDAIDRIYSIGYKIDFTFPIEELRKIDNIKIIEKKKDVFRFSIPDFQMNPIMRPFWGETHHEYPFAFFCWVGREKPDSKEYIIKLCLEMEGLNQTDKNHKQFIEEVLNNKISKEYTLEKEKPCRWHLKEVKRNVLIENWDNGEESAKIIISLYNELSGVTETLKELILRSFQSSNSTS